MQSLSDYYHSTHPRLPFTLAFLDSRNIAAIHQALASAALAHPGVGRTATVPFSDGLLGALMQYATHRAGYAAETVPEENDAFVRYYLPPLAAELLQQGVWARWADTGFPNPNEVPLPEARPRKLRRQDTDASIYLTSRPAFEKPPGVFGRD